MTDEDGFRIEAALQFGFQESGHNEGDATDVYLCTEAQLIAFAKACERKGRAVAAKEARETANAAGVAELHIFADQLDAQNAATDAELAPILEAERVRYLTARGYVRCTDEPGRCWVKPVRKDLDDLAADSLAAHDARECSCHPDDKPPVPCTRKFALTECRREHLDQLLRDANSAYLAMTPEQQAEHWRAQAESWARQMKD